MPSKRSKKYFNYRKLCKIVNTLEKDIWEVEFPVIDLRGSALTSKDLEKALRELLEDDLIYGRSKIKI